MSVRAGVFEEIIFRWLVFLNAIWFAKLVNWLIFGWAGFGVPEFIYGYVIAPISNFITCGDIHDLLYHPLGWFIGSAIITANAKFHDGHKYLGWLGFINSWFVGVYLFHVLFAYGLPAVILVHFLYDALIDVVNYADALRRRAAKV
jgi:hypothetical protein